MRGGGLRVERDRSLQLFQRQFIFAALKMRSAAVKREPKIAFTRRIRDYWLLNLSRPRLAGQEDQAGERECDYLLHGLSVVIGFKVMSRLVGDYNLPSADRVITHPQRHNLLQQGLIIHAAMRSE